MRQELARGTAPFRQQARALGLAFSGWGWDVKAGDFLNSGSLEIVQAEGFVKGKINRWPWLQEMAMTNDNIYTNPRMWPNMRPGDDIAGSQPVAFFTRRDRTDTFVNISKQLGLAVPVPSRGIAMGDTRGNGRLDFAIARQWGAPAFYANNSPDLGAYLGLRLYRPSTGPVSESAGGGLSGIGAPAYGTTVRIRASDGRTQVSQLDGGSGHSGRRGFQVRFGLGAARGPVTVELRWRGRQGVLHRQSLQLNPGTHALLLDGTAKEVGTS
jgi:hypothetical protein